MSQIMKADKVLFAAWFSTPNLAMAEIAKRVGYHVAILDIEHGNFDLGDLERFIPSLKAIGLKVYAKTGGPFREAMQQPLDFGADAIIIPHIEGYEHAKKITQFSKFPPLGDRSSAGGRTSQYLMADDEWFIAQDKITKCFPMIEDKGALLEVEKILGLDTVDGVFIGPTDLSLRMGRGSYKRSPEDWRDIRRVLSAAVKAGKTCIFPAWSDSEKKLAYEEGAGVIALTMEHISLTTGLEKALNDMKSIAENVDGENQ